MQAKVRAIFSVLFFGYLVNAYPFSQFFLNNARIITLDEECAVDQDTMFLTTVTLIYGRALFKHVMAQFKGRLAKFHVPNFVCVCLSGLIAKDDLVC